MKRFWTSVTVESRPGGYGFRLDARPLNTPARQECVVPSRALAEAIAEEWRAAEGEVNPLAMPLTRAANAAIDRVARARDEVAGMLAGYGGTDLICYRAPNPPELARRQAEAWDPLLAWAAGRYGARLVLTEGVMHVSQDAGAMARLAGAVARHETWELTALHDLVTIPGSLVIGLAVSEGRLTAEEAWCLGRIDEDWNVEQWGEDAEEAARAAQRRTEFLEAARLLALVRAG